MHSLTFCVRVMSPERHHWKPAVQAAAVMLRTPPPSTASHRPASHAHLRYTVCNVENADDRDHALRCCFIGKSCTREYLNLYIYGRVHVCWTTKESRLIFLWQPLINTSKLVSSLLQQCVGFITRTHHISIAIDFLVICSVFWHYWASGRASSL